MAALLHRVMMLTKICVTSGQGLTSNLVQFLQDLFSCHLNWRANSAWHQGNMLVSFIQSVILELCHPCVQVPGTLQQCQLLSGAAVCPSWEGRAVSHLYQGSATLSSPTYELWALYYSMWLYNICDDLVRSFTIPAVMQVVQAAAYNFYHSEWVALLWVKCRKRAVLFKPCRVAHWLYSTLHSHTETGLVLYSTS